MMRKIMVLCFVAMGLSACLGMGSSEMYGEIKGGVEYSRKM